MDQRWSVSSHRITATVPRSLRFKDLIVVLTLSQYITHLISAPARILIAMVSVPKSVCWRASKVQATKYENEQVLPSRHVYNSPWFCHKLSDGQSCCQASSSPARLGGAFQVSYQKIFTSVKYCSSILSADIGNIGPRRHRTFRSLEDHSPQDMIKSQTGCSI